MKYLWVCLQLSLGLQSLGDDGSDVDHRGFRHLEHLNAKVLDVALVIF